jgi:transcriptional regulator with XRE-family HTH domain
MEGNATPKLLFGAAARDLRLQLGLTQRAMAKRVEISYQHLAHIERNQNRPSLDLLDRWRKVFEMDLYVDAYWWGE